MHSIHTCTFCGDVYVDTYVDATDHSYSEPQWTWDGYDAANATFTCSNCDGNVTVKAVVTRKVTVDVAVGVEGEAILTANFTPTALPKLSLPRTADVFWGAEA